MNQEVFLYSCAGVGAIAVIAVAYVFIRTQTFKTPGFGLLLSGTILIGLPVWSTAKLSWNKDGFNLEFETLKRTLAALDTKLTTINTASEKASADIKALANASQNANTDLKAIAANVSKVRATSNLAFATRLLPATTGGYDFATELGPEFTTGFINAPKLNLIFSDSLKKAIYNTELIADKVQKEVPLSSLPGKEEK